MEHLHLDLGLGGHIGGWAEGNAIRVHPTSALVLREQIDGSIDISHRCVPILRDVLVEFLSSLVFLLRKRGGMVFRRKATEIESASRRSGMRGIYGG